MNNVSLRVKLVGGFVAVAMISLIIGLFGWNALAGLGRSLYDMGRVRMPAVHSLAEMKTSLETLRVMQGALINPELSKEDRELQKTASKVAEKEFKVNYAVYEALPHTPAEKALWAEFVPLFAQWESAYQTFLNLNTDLEATGILNPLDLVEKLELFRGDHYALATRILTVLIGGEETFEGGVDPSKCRLGIWMVTFETGNEGLRKSLKRISEPHAKFHQAAASIKEMIDDGMIDVASAVFMQEFEPAGKEFMAEFDLIIAEAEKASGLYHSMNRQATFECSEKQQRALVVLDKIIELNSSIAEHEMMEAGADAHRSEVIMVVGMLAGFALALLLGVLLSISIVKTLVKGVKFSEQMARGDLTGSVDIPTKDETGALGDALNLMVKNLNRMFRDVGKDVETLSASSGNLSSLSEEMSAEALQTTEKAHSVAAAGEQMSMNMISVASSMDQASDNIGIVASATEEMTSTIGEIAQNSEKARTITENAVVQARDASSQVGELGDAADQIGTVIESITEISEQVNLLALNATIEAARAGEAGKGFAVVANEIKALAKQTADAAGEIQGRVTKIQNSAGNTVGQIGNISSVVNEINEIVSTIATAVEEQSVTTREISENVSQVSSGIIEASENVSQSSAAAAEIARDISGVTEAAGEMSNNSSQVNLSANDLSGLAAGLKGLVGKFKV